MKPIENTFEEEPILALPPVGQRVAYELFSSWSLPRMMEAWLQGQEDTDLLRTHNCPSRLWPEILSAAMVAKVTYFLPNSRFDHTQINYLIRLACTHVGYPLNQYSLAEVVGVAQQKFPVLYTWLRTFLQLLNRKGQGHD